MLYGIMCGIFGYIGRQNAISVGLRGIRQLEYRGYDSAGVAYISDNAIQFQKAVGKIDELEKKLNNTVNSHTALYHSRWATHGGVTEANAHPHTDCAKKIALVHNGIIENYQELKKELIQKKHIFSSETDTEVLTHLIEQIINDTNCTPEEAVRKALKRVKGTYGVAVLFRDFPNTIIVARNFSPLLIGIGNHEYIVASDASAIAGITKDVLYLRDGEMAVVTPDGVTISDNLHNNILREKETLDFEAWQAHKKDFAHFMLKEIFEEPEAIENSIRGRILEDEGRVRLGGIVNSQKILQHASRIIISGCGTAYFAGEVGKYMIEEYAGVPVELAIASEFRYRKPIFKEGDVFFAVSQSGETADTLSALREAKAKGVPVFGILNSIGSTIAKEAGQGIYQHVGPEIGVASTKAFISQVAIFALFTVFLGRSRSMSLTMGRRIGQELKKIPKLIQNILDQSDGIKSIAEKYSSHNNFLYLGRKYNYAIAKEGALKLKEISYIHAEGYAGGEMKHGALALIDKNFPTIVIAPKDSVYEKMVSNIQEIRARGGPVIAITTEGNVELAEMVDAIIYIPKTLEMLTPLLSVIPLQLFAYYAGVLRKCDVDRPRNLAKSVTVE